MNIRTSRFPHDHIFQDERASSPTCFACRALRREPPIEEPRPRERIVLDA